MKPSTATVQLKRGRERPIANGHPWVFSGAIARWEGSPQVGTITDVRAHDGTWLARGMAHPEADLAVRLYTWREGQDLTDDYLAARISEAVALRARLFSDQTETNAYRLVYSEADGLSGLIVDRYADMLAVRVVARVLVPYLPSLLDRISACTGLKNIHVSTDADCVRREGMDAKALAELSTAGDPVVQIREHGFVFVVNLASGQKTGFYLDQRENRQRVAAYAAGRRVLSAYCYTGAFEVHAATAGAAAITGLDSSESALVQARRHHEINGIKVTPEYMAADVPKALRKFRDEGRQFDLIVLDPPRFVMNEAQKAKGMRAYKDINLLAIKLLTEGGILATFSCSGLISREDLRMAVSWAAKDAGRRVRIIESLGQPADHPVLVTFPESEYLSGLICYIDSM